MKGGDFPACRTAAAARSRPWLHLGARLHLGDYGVVVCRVGAAGCAAVDARRVDILAEGTALRNDRRPGAMHRKTPALCPASWPPRDRHVAAPPHHFSLRSLLGLSRRSAAQVREGLRAVGGQPQGELPSWRGAGGLGRLRGPRMELIDATVPRAGTSGASGTGMHGSRCIWPKDTVEACMGPMDYQQAHASAQPQHSTCTVPRPPSSSAARTQKVGT